MFKLAEDFKREGEEEDWESGEQRGIAGEEREII